MTAAPAPGVPPSMALLYFTGKFSLLEIPNAKDSLSLTKMPRTIWNKWIKNNAGPNIYKGT